MYNLTPTLSSSHSKMKSLQIKSSLSLLNIFQNQSQDSVRLLRKAYFENKRSPHSFQTFFKGAVIHTERLSAFLASACGYQVQNLQWQRWGHTVGESRELLLTFVLWLHHCACAVTQQECDQQKAIGGKPPWQKPPGLFSLQH